MTSKKVFKIFFICIVLLVATSICRNFEDYFLMNSLFSEALSFILQAVVHTGIVAYWSVTVIRRIMHKQLKYYLLFFSTLEIFWFLIRNIKWRAFENLYDVGRLFWYMYYIPMLLLPVIAILIVLCMNKEESYRIHKRWYLFLVPSIIFILLVLTNDFHHLVFSFPNGDYFWYTDKKYEVVYVLLMSFIGAVILFSVFILYKKWRTCNRSKLQYLPIITIAITVIYIALYISGNKIINNFIDLTTFDCLMLILFWESCIQVGLIRSNSNHINFFEKSQISAEILDTDGNVCLKSLNSKSISQDEFLKLKKSGEIKSNHKKNMLINMTAIERGYVIWNKDVSDIVKMNEELNELNSELYGEVAFLEEERKLKEERSRVDKLNNIYNLISNEILPYMNKINNLVQESNSTSLEIQDDILKKINLISCYVKRKTNLLLQVDSDIAIKNSDMKNCYKEIFRGLSLFGTEYDINYNPPSNLSSVIHLYCYDLFQQVLEILDYNLKLVFINFKEDKNGLRFSINISNTEKSLEQIFTFKKERLKMINGNIKIYDDDDSKEIILLLSNAKGVTQ